MIIYATKKNKNVSSVQPRKDEKLILQEDCSEDHLKNGLLTLTNQRIFFEKTEGTLATLSKRPGELLLDIPLNEIKESKTEGFLLKKVVIITISGDTYKFGVLNNSKWAKEIEKSKSNIK
ncbi:MAG TPA: PH domain-containing protein [Nitrososphaeraceae archaeon]|nr:PH domain-containing protein [Nitrososphaeraceae archaeon]